MDEEFRRRLESTVRTVQQWDADADLLRQCRQRIFSPAVRPHLGAPGDSARDFLQQFVRYFKEHVMVWCNQPACMLCDQKGDNMEARGSRGPVTAAERQGAASRVEVYRCTTCHVESTFPRYNNVQTLYEISCQGDAKTPGRCGEYANLFGFYCRALGLETRFILDWTDHVWVEVLLRCSTDEAEQWCMIDSCEGVLHEYSMYERGWGKELNYVVAVSTTALTDVTCKYTRKLREASFQQRRRAITSSEDSSRRIIQQMNESLRSTLSAKDAKMVQERWQREVWQLQQLSQLSSWPVSEQYQLGRLSGSLQWKALRNETGNTSTTDVANGSSRSDTLPQWFYVGTPYNTTYDSSSGNDFDIYLRQPPLHLSEHEYCHEMIQVNQVPCAIGCRNALSVVVLDEAFDTDMGGCILQSNSFTTLRDFLDFVSSVPSQRILIVVGSIPTQSNEDWITSEERDTLSLELGEQFCADHIPGGILYIGQVFVSEQPSWSICGSYDSAPNGIEVSAAKKENGNNEKAESKSDSPERKLCTFPNVRPRKICGRVPDMIMPLSTQCEAGYEAKRKAFLSYMETNPRVPCFGYTTKSGTPIYLLGSTSYPLIESNKGIHDDHNSQDNCWNTFLLLPSILVPEEDNGIADCSMQNTESPSLLPLYEVPLDQAFFQNELGDQLLLDGSRLPTTDALHNTRLVAYYFSAHWCGPCRSFTPILAELYTIIKEAYPSHGLEIVFVSSDRDEQSFNQYFRTMPWLALPFDDSLRTSKQRLSAKYHVKGIPSLVVLDSISGQIVIPNTESRSLVMQTVQCGADKAIADMFSTAWLDRIPFESKEILSMLATSCRYETVNAVGQEIVSTSPKVTSFLLRSTYIEKQQRIEMLTAQLIDEEEMDPDQAKEAAFAVEALVGESDSEHRSASRLNGYFLSKNSDLSTGSERIRSASDFAKNVSNASSEQLKSVLVTLWKYFVMCYETPWISKFRQFQLSFKVADRITVVPGGLEVAESLGFQILFADFDFVAVVPISADLHEMKESIRKLCIQFDVCT